MSNNDKIRIAFITFGIVLVFLIAALVEPCPEGSCAYNYKITTK
jgi:hypothetical protein